jgi:hypothetical protein
VATREDLQNDILKDNEDQMNSFRITTQIMKYEDFIRDTEKQLRTMN